MALTISPGTPQDTAQIAPPLRKLAGIISPAPAAVSARKRLLKWDPLTGKACDSGPDGPIARNTVGGQAALLFQNDDCFLLLLLLS